MNVKEIVNELNKCNTLNESELESDIERMKEFLNLSWKEGISKVKDLNERDCLVALIALNQNSEKKRSDNIKYVIYNRITRLRRLREYDIFNIKHSRPLKKNKEE